MKHFNTYGPIIPEDHYYIPPLARVPLDRWCNRKCILFCTRCRSPAGPPR